MSDPDPRWVRVGQKIEARMQELGLTDAKLAELKGPTDKTIRRYIQGAPITRRDRGEALCRVLEWDPASIGIILGGGDPVETASPPPSVIAKILSAVADLEQRVARLEQPEPARVLRAAKKRPAK